MRRLVASLAIPILLASAQALGQTQAFPSRAIRMITTVPPGSAPDVVARTVAQKLAVNIGVPVTVDNRTGAGGLIGANATINAAPDGYTVLMADTGVFAILPNLKSTFDPLKSLTPVTSAGTTPIYLAVAAGLNVNSVKDLVALAKNKPGMPYGSGGTGGAAHLFMELIKTLGGVEMTHIPYKGVAPAVQALVTGEVVAVFSGVNLLVPMEKAGKLKIIAVASQQRIARMPDLPTVAESGLPGFNMNTLTLGFFVPTGTPPDIVDKLRTDLSAALKAPEVRERLAGLAVDEPTDSSAESLAQTVRAELAQYAKLIKAAGVTAQQ